MFAPRGQTRLSPYRPRPLSPRAGVTLVEMVVVVGIVALIMAVAAPSMTSALDSVRMASAADNVASFLNSAVNRAERRQQPVEVVISAKDNKFVLFSNDPGGPREMKLPDGIAIDAILPRDDNELDTGVRRLLLLPGASVPAVGVQLINGHRNRRLITLDPMTGYPRIRTPEAEP